MDAITYDLMTANRNEEVEKTIRKEHNRLFNFIRKSVGDIEETKDSLQDVFYQYVLGYDEIRSVDSITSWLYTVAKNKITDMFRKKKALPMSIKITNENTDDDENMWTLENILTDIASLPDDEYFNNMIWEEIESALDELPVKQREVFVMNEFDGKSFKEISKTTGDSINTLLSRKRYAVLYLRERLRDLFNEL
jgi:RNA polymerase sigma factor (sigma-70 family)